MAVGYPVRTMVARPVAELPAGSGWAFEPKYDGFRCVAHAEGGRVRLQSRQDRSLTRYFPEVIAAIAEQLGDVVLDGELVVHRGGRIDFAALQHRLTASDRSAARLAAETPACFVVFDVLACDGHDLRAEPYLARRGQLHPLLDDARPPLALTPATTEWTGAHAWMEGYAEAGIEGVVAKRLGHGYRPGRRWWHKVRTRASTDTIVGGVIGWADAPAALILGRWDARGRLRVVGKTHLLPAAATAELGALLTPPAGAHPWPATIPASRFGLPGGDRVRYVQVQPMVVVEVEVDTAYEHGRWRHGARFRRVRSELQASDVALAPG